jgi:hypothetical protein
MELDRVPLWRGDHVAIPAARSRTSAATLYLPRLRDPGVLGLRLLTWSQDTFAYTESFDEEAHRYRGLRCGEIVNVSEDNPSGLLVRMWRASSGRPRRRRRGAQRTYRNAK